MLAEMVKAMTDEELAELARDVAREIADREARRIWRDAPAAVREQEA